MNEVQEARLKIVRVGLREAHRILVEDGQDDQAEAVRDLMLLVDGVASQPPSWAAGVESITRELFIRCQRLLDGLSRKRQFRPGEEIIRGEVSVWARLAGELVPSEATVN